MLEETAYEKLNSQPELLLCKIPLNKLINNNMSLSVIKSLGREHNIDIIRKSPKTEWINACNIHYCSLCDKQITTFLPYNDKKIERKEKIRKISKVKRSEENQMAYKNNKDRFPPSPPSKHFLENIALQFCNSLSPDVFSESGCTVCGLLNKNTDLESFENFVSNCKKKNKEFILDILKPIYAGTGVYERHSSFEPLKDIEGILIDKHLEKICKYCIKSLKKNTIPKFALANGTWLGEIPDELKDLKYAEKMLISRYQHNRCITIVRNGAHKMCSNAITFQNPTSKIYDKLPPPREDLDQVLACIFTGPAAPTNEDFERCPLLVRRKKVTMALEWLKLNHKDYSDLEIAYDILKTYPENDIPVVVDYRHTNSNRLPETMSVHDDGEEQGTEEGDCSFVVHHLVGEDLNYKGAFPETLKTIAIDHIRRQRRVLAVGHSESPCSMYNDPQYFPKLFPWLFPYGTGGIGNSLIRKKISEKEHKNFF